MLMSFEKWPMSLTIQKGPHVNMSYKKGPHVNISYIKGPYANMSYKMDTMLICHVK